MIENLTSASSKGFARQNRKDGYHKIEWVVNM